MNTLKYYCILTLSLFIMIGTTSCQNNLGIFDNNIDIGKCKNKGSAIYNSENQTYTIEGSGVNMWFGKDEFH
ncbi:biopolymer transporter TolR, partial [Bacteroidota bacterium]